MRYVLDDEAVTGSLINIDDARIQNINEKSVMMYPDDNSIMRVDHFAVGGQQFAKSIVLKDNLRFGLRQKKAFDLPHTEYGLVR
jgi:hypothetical protein